MSYSRRNFLRRISLTAAAASGISVAGCLGILSSDHARYFSVSAISIDDFDYNSTKTAAETAGYTVDGPYYGTLKETSVGFHPDGIDALNERFGADYRVNHVVFNYSPNTRVYAGFREDSDTELYLRDERAWSGPDPFLPEYLPEEDWLIERLTLLFDVGTERAREYIAQLVDAITTEQTDLPSIDVSEPVSFADVYQYLVQGSTVVEGTHSHGEGWHIVTYGDDEGPFAEVGYRLQSTKVTHKSGKGTYIVQFDPLGAIGLEVTLPAGESIPEDERRSVFREMFSSLGLPPELVGDVEFDYVGSMW